MRRVRRVCAYCLKSIERREHVEQVDDLPLRFLWQFGEFHVHLYVIDIGVSTPFKRESATQLNELEAAKVEPLDLFPFPSNGRAQRKTDQHLTDTTAKTSFHSLQTGERNATKFSMRSLNTAKYQDKFPFPSNGRTQLKKRRFEMKMFDADNAFPFPSNGTAQRNVTGRRGFKPRLRGWFPFHSNGRAQRNLFLIGYHKSIKMSSFSEL